MKLVAVLLVMTLSFPLFPARKAEAIFEQIAALVASIVLDEIIKKVKEDLAKTAGDITQEVDKEFLYQGLISNQQGNQRDLEKKLYSLDHLELRDKVYEVLRLPYSSFSGDGVLSFGGSWNASRFDETYTGYRTGTTIYSDAYRERVKNFESYIKKIAASNNSEAGFIIDTSLKAIKSLQDAMLKAGEFTSGGYRQLTQAENQIINYSNVQISRARTDIMRHVDQTAALAHNEIQEKTDRHSAFRQAVSTWQSIPVGNLSY